MNKILKYILISTIVGANILSLYSCSKSEEWQPGPQVSADNPGVYFDTSTPGVLEMGANKQGELLSEYLTIPVGRDANKASSALQVPVKIRYADPNLSVIETIDFAAGSTESELKVSISQFEFSTPYSLSVEIDEKYANPYRSYLGQTGGSSRLDVKIEVVSILGTATFTATDFSGSSKPAFYPFEHKIYDNRDGTYTIKNFLFNNAGYNFNFSIDDQNNIRPSADCGYHSTGDDRWYFYSANSDASANRIPCYIPGANSDDYVTYIYFYTAENTSKYTDFWIDLTNKTGRMMGYSRFSVSSSGRVAFNIVIK